MMRIIGYKTINKVNGHYYYGVRTLWREDDPYLGSGRRIQEAIRKYGRESFERIEIQEFNSFSEALKWEKSVVTLELLQDGNCYNLKPGGAGGSLPWTEERKAQVKDSGTYKKSGEVRKKMSIATRKRFENSPGTFKGKFHSEESRRKMSEVHRGKRGVNKGKKLNLSEERREALRKPKSEEQKEKIRRTLRHMSEDQVTYLKTEFIDDFGARTKICKEWNVSLEQIAKVLGRRYKNRRTKTVNCGK